MWAWTGGEGIEIRRSRRFEMILEASFRCGHEE